MSLEADGVLGLELVRPDGAEVEPWQPGAHIDLVLGEGLVRQYSLCGDPADLLRYRVAVLREPDGRGGSAWVHSRMRPGDLVEVRGLRNHFALADAERYLFVAGGIGITALLPMIEEVAGRGRGYEVVYCGRSRTALAFLDRLAVHGDRVRVAASDEGGRLDLADAVGPYRPGTAVYCCGPERMIAAVEAACAGWPADTLRTERFAAPAPTAPEPDAESGFEVFLARTGRSVQVDPGTSILDAVLAAGVDVLTDCREGICASCETPVLEGTVDHRDFVLTERERATNSVLMLCVSRASCPRLVLDL